MAARAARSARSPLALVKRPMSTILTVLVYILRVPLYMWNEKTIHEWRTGVNIHGRLAPTLPLKSHNASRLHKRKRELAEMDGNARTPEKTARKGKSASLTHGASEDENATPRPPHPLSNMVHLQSPNTANSTMARERDSRDSAPLSSAPSSRSSTHTTSSRGVKRKRPTSPAKQLEERQYARYPIQHRPVTNPDSVNEHIRDTIKRVRNIARAKAILSPGHADLAQILSGGDNDLARDILQNGDEIYGAPPDLARMQRIVERATRNVTLSASEAAWNSGVHDSLLEEAHIGSSVKEHLVWENITTASTIPALPLENDDVERADPRKVDFCVALEFYNYDQLGQRLYQAGVHHLNHTDYGPVRYKPIALSIETKLTGEGGATAVVQLSTWVTAQILHLKALCHWARGDAYLSDPQIPPLPLLVIQGHTWSLYYLEHDHRRNGATLWSCGQFASTETLLGAYQVTAALQVLMYWAAKLYRPWFEENILRPRDLLPTEES